MGAIYKGLQFKTPLHATWAAFFDFAGWEWHVNPASVEDWAPDFWVKFPCSHSECDEHILLVAVLPVSDVADFGNHPCLKHVYCIENDPQGIHNLVQAGAAFGNFPAATRWEFAHGAGSGTFEVPFFVENSEELWSTAENIVMEQHV